MISSMQYDEFMHSKLGCTGIMTRMDHAMHAIIVSSGQAAAAAGAAAAVAAASSGETWGFQTCMHRESLPEDRAGSLEVLP